MITVVIEGDPDGVYPTSTFDNGEDAVVYAIKVLTTAWEGSKGAPGVHFIGIGEDYEKDSWTLEKLRELQRRVEAKRSHCR